MGATIICNVQKTPTPQNKSSKHQQDHSIPESKQPQLVVSQIANNQQGGGINTSRFTNAVNASTPQSQILSPSPHNQSQIKQNQETSALYQASGLCYTHPNEYLKAICLNSECNQEHQVLCVDCLISHECTKKMKISDFVIKFRSIVNRERLEILNELFETNQCQKDIEKHIQSSIDHIKEEIENIISVVMKEKFGQYFINNSELSTIKEVFNNGTLYGLQTIINDNVENATEESITLGVKLLNNRKMVDTICQQVEELKSKQIKVVTLLRDRIVILGTKYLNAIKFVFSIFPTNLDYVFEEEQLVIKNEKQIGQSNILSFNHQEKKVEVKTKNITKIVQSSCSDHNNFPFTAICIENEWDGKRKFCSECLIEQHQGHKMKISEFHNKLQKLMSKEIFEQLQVPFESNALLENLKKQLNEIMDQIKQLYQTTTEQQIQNIQIQFHTFEGCLPKELQKYLDKDTIVQLCSIAQDKYDQVKKQTVQLIQQPQLIESIVNGIIKTQTMLPKKTEFLKKKLLSINNNFIDKIKTLFKSGNEFNSECPIDLDENLAFEETLYKQHMNKSKTDHDMYKEQKSFTPYKKLSITDIVKVTDSIIGISYFDGNIILYNNSANKKDAKITHGTFCSCLCTVFYNKKIRLLSAGTLDSQPSIILWDLNKIISIQKIQTHSDSIRKLKLVMNDRLMSCSDDGSIKIWQISNTSLMELKTFKPHFGRVMDVIFLEQVIVSVGFDCNVIATDYNENLVIQKIQDDCPLISVCQVDMNKFAVGNDKGYIKIYGYQMQRMILQKQLQIHNDTVNRLIHLQNNLIGSCSVDRSISLVIPLQGHSTTVTGLLHLKETGQLISGDQEGVIKIWG